MGMGDPHNKPIDPRRGELPMRGCQPATRAAISALMAAMMISGCSRSVQEDDTGELFRMNPRAVIREPEGAPAISGRASRMIAIQESLKDPVSPDDWALIRWSLREGSRQESGSAALDPEGKLLGLACPIEKGLSSRCPPEMSASLRSARPEMRALRQALNGRGQSAKLRLEFDPELKARWKESPSGDARSTMILQAELVGRCFPRWSKTVTTTWSIPAMKDTKTRREFQGCQDP